MCPCRPQRDPGVKEPPSPRSPPPNTHTLAIVPPRGPEEGRLVGGMEGRRVGCSGGILLGTLGGAGTRGLRWPLEVPLYVIMPSVQWFQSMFLVNKFP